jgi:ABC-type multidrug transport system fused ATPase/permease subunit
LFDDAFSALDVHTDAQVRSALAEIAADATVIIVAQRISTIIDADQVIVVDDGRVVGAGTHESLLADCPTYREFAESQSLDFRVGGPR